MTTTVLPASGPAPAATARRGGASASTPASRSAVSAPPVTGSPKKRAIDAATTTPTPGTPSYSSGAAARRKSAARRLHSAALSPSAGGPCSASHPARSIAVCSPTWRMPSALRTRARGRRRARSIAATRFSALLRAKRSSPSACSTVSRKRSAGVFTNPRSRSWTITAGPAPSMSMALRETKWRSPCATWAGQNGLVQRWRTSPSSRTTGASQTGQRSGISKGRSAPVRRSGRTRTTSGMTSPALCRTTRSPTRTSLRRTSSRLWSVARETVEPATFTGARWATGVSVPVRPT